MKTIIKTTSCALLVPFLLTAMTAIGMEPKADYPQLQLGLSQKPPKPLIEVRLHAKPTNSARYAGLSFRQEVENAGIRSQNSTSPKMPFIPTIARVKNPKNGKFDFLWKSRISSSIYDYERQQIKAAGKEITQEDCLAIITKNAFPHALPASLFHNCTTGSILNFTVHGYPVVAECYNDDESTSVEKQFNKQIDSLKLNPKPDFFTTSVLTQNADKQELINANVLTEAGDHGANGFVSMEDLLLEDIRKRYGSIHNYLIKRQMGA